MAGFTEIATIVGAAATVGCFYVGAKQLKLMKPKGKGKSDNEKSPTPANIKLKKTVPDGVRFHSTVIHVPPMPGYFDRLLWEAGGVSGGMNSLCQLGDWIRTGDPLYRINVFNRSIGLPFWSDPVYLEIRSPVDGLVLWEGGDVFYSYGDSYDNDKFPPFAILPVHPGRLPDTANDVYAQVADVLWGGRRALVKKWSLDEDELYSKLTEMRSGIIGHHSITEYQQSIDVLWKQGVPKEVIEQLRQLLKDAP